jgi:hypothetical protein
VIGFGGFVATRSPIRNNRNVNAYQATLLPSIAYIGKPDAKKVSTFP